jgi:hypothetical protein
VECKAGAQITSASGIEQPVRNRTKHINVNHCTISQAEHVPPPMSPNATTVCRARALPPGFSEVSRITGLRTPQKPSSDS